jgi:dolichol-phosphate mannosyltransferase
LIGIGRMVAASDVPRTGPPAPELPSTLRAAPELSIVIPTFKERQNVPALVDVLRRALANLHWEVIFVDDDSPDGTSEVARSIGERDERVRVIRRLGRRGLSGACLEGALSSQAAVIAVMDADLQHDESLLLPMLDMLKNNRADLVVASRYAAGGSPPSLSTRRARVSQWGTVLAQHLLGVKLSDPMSGFFMIRRHALEDIAPLLSLQGFKILLDIVATARGRLRVEEIPYRFRGRLHGESKLDAKIGLEFAALLLSKLTRGALSLRFLSFCLVGLTGLMLHLALLRFGLLFGRLRFEIAQTVSTLIVIAWNFYLNNVFTYSDLRLRQWDFVSGLIRFEMICIIGVVANIGVARWIYGYGNIWWIAGLGGALMGAVWNFALSAAFVWQARRPPPRLSLRDPD